MISYIVSIVMSVISGLLLAIIKGLVDDNRQLKKKKQEEEQIREKAMQDGIMLLLRVQLINIHERYMRDGDGIIPQDAYENFNDMYEVYSELGGNGMVKHMQEAIDKLRLSNLKDKE